MGLSKIASMGRGSRTATPGGDETWALGYFYQGGYYIGDVTVSATTYAILLAPKSSGQGATTSSWGPLFTVTGATSAVDGLSNSTVLNSASYTPAFFCMNLTLNDYSDWYLPATNELLLAQTTKLILPTAERMDDDTYWSSTETNNVYAVAINMNPPPGPVYSTTGKDNLIRYRAVRRVDKSTI